LEQDEFNTSIIELDDGQILDPSTLCDVTAGIGSPHSPE